MVGYYVSREQRENCLRQAESCIATLDALRAAGIEIPRLLSGKSWSDVAIEVDAFADFCGLTDDEKAGIGIVFDEDNAGGLDDAEFDRLYWIGRSVYTRIDDEWIERTGHDAICSDDLKVVRKQAVRAAGHERRKLRAL